MSEEAEVDNNVDAETDYQWANGMPYCCKCAHWKGHAEDDGRLGDCTRFPPVLLTTTVERFHYARCVKEGWPVSNTIDPDDIFLASYFPVTNCDGGCGEFRDKEAAS